SDDVLGFLGGGRGDDHLGEDFDDFGGRFGVDLAVEGDNAAKGRDRIGAQGLLIGLDQGRADGHAAGIGVLDDGNGGGLGRVELGNELEGGVGVIDIVVGERLALGLGGGGHARTVLAGLVEGGPLMRVFAIAHHFAQRAGKAAIGDVLEIDLAGEPARDGAVIGGRAGIGLGGELLAQFIGNATGLDGLEDLRIVGRVDNDGHICVVLGGGADHGGAANVDI